MRALRFYFRPFRSDNYNYRGVAHNDYEEMGIGQIIKARREARGWSQRELARYTQDKVTQAAISKIESGQDSSIRMETLRLIARAFNCATVDLLPEEDKRIAASRKQP